jgi:hypothetical protein
MYSGKALDFCFEEAWVEFLPDIVIEESVNCFFSFSSEWQSTEEPG